MVVTTKSGDGNLTYNYGQMIVYDKKKEFSCRFNEQNLLNPDEFRPVDYCNSKNHFKIRDASGSVPPDKLNCSMKDSYQFLTFAWPSEFMSNAVFQGVDKVNQKDCNHFLVQSMTVNGASQQVDAWTGAKDGLICQMTFNNQDTNEIMTYSFDGFQQGYPGTALACTSALIKCARDDWVCRVRNGTKDKDIINALKWVCTPSGGKVDCAPINPGGKYFNPNTPIAHGNWALNEYYQTNKILGGETACYFGGIGNVVPPKNQKFSQPKVMEDINVFDHLMRGLVC